MRFYNLDGLTSLRTRDNVMPWFKRVEQLLEHDRRYKHDPEKMIQRYIKPQDQRQYYIQENLTQTIIPHSEPERMWCRDLLRRGIYKSTIDVINITSNTRLYITCIKFKDRWSFLTQNPRESNPITFLGGAATGVLWMVLTGPRRRSGTTYTRI